MGLASVQDYPTVLGSFVEKTAGQTHEYSPNNTGMMHHYPHKLWTLDGFRYANIHKTVAYIVTDEDEYGNPVVEKWQIKQHKTF
jgi:hypothetical protein